MAYDSVFNRTQNEETNADAEKFMQQANLYANMPVDYTGNINLANRPQVNMPDGSIATVRSMSFNDNGKERLIPTISQSGQALSPEQAIAEYQRTGQHLGLFNNVADANAMAQRIHEQQASGLPSNVPQQTPAPTAATQAAAQGAAVAARKPTPEEFQMNVIRDLMVRKGYSYGDAADLMAPYIGMYKFQDAAEKKQQAEALSEQLNKMKIDSDEYRAGVLKLSQLDPTMAKFYAGDMVTRKDLWNRQNKLDDLAAAHQWQEYMRNVYGRGGRGGGGRGGGGGGGRGRGRSADPTGAFIKTLGARNKFLDGEIKRLRGKGENLTANELAMLRRYEDDRAATANQLYEFHMGRGSVDQDGNPRVGYTLEQANDGLEKLLGAYGGKLPSEVKQATAARLGVSESALDNVEAAWAKRSDARIAAQLAIDDEGSDYYESADDRNARIRAARQAAQAAGFGLDNSGNVYAQRLPGEVDRLNTWKKEHPEYALIFGEEEEREPGSID